MAKIEARNAARIAAAAGLGLTLALGAAPVVALAEGTGVAADDQVSVPAQDTNEKNAVFIGEQGYATLRDALLEAKNGDVIKVIADNYSEYGWSGAENANVTIDLNGYASTFKDSKTITNMRKPLSSGTTRLVRKFRSGPVLIPAGRARADAR